MQQVEIIKQLKKNIPNRNYNDKILGKYFTSEFVGKELVRLIISCLSEEPQEVLNIIDPFCGDGRLLVWLMEELAKKKCYEQTKINIAFWDILPDNIILAERKLRRVITENNFNNCVLNKKICDTFEEIQNHSLKYHIVITNPPWENVKPDKRDAKNIEEDQIDEYKAHLKALSLKLLSNYKQASPAKLYSGWGVNLSRVGLEVSANLLEKKGCLGIVMPASFVADQLSQGLREWYFTTFSCKSIYYYPAEMKLFKDMDQPFVTMISKNETVKNLTKLVALDKSGNNASVSKINLRSNLIKDINYCIPVTLTNNQNRIFFKVQKNTKISHLEKTNLGFWIGRELDETGISDKFGSGTPFIKGRDIERFKLKNENANLINVSPHQISKSVKYYRIVWRDVSRPSQKRRMKATIIPPGILTGNSLGVMHLGKDSLTDTLLWFLAVVSSFVFEFQVRALSKTGHLSAGLIRQIAMPCNNKNNDKIINLAKKVLEQGELKMELESELEVAIAESYNLNLTEFEEILESFPAIEANEKRQLLDNTKWRKLDDTESLFA